MKNKNDPNRFRLLQETAYQEQIRIFGDSKRLPNLSDLNEMVYLEMVLKEAQRLYPSVPMIGRRIHEDIKLSMIHLNFFTSCQPSKN